MSFDYTLRKRLQIAVIIIVFMFVLSFYFYERMPSSIDSHWNYKGEADGQMSKFWGLFLVPLISTGLFLLLVLIPILDPLKRNITKFINHYDSFIVAFISFMFYLHTLTILWNIGINFNFVQAIVPAFSVLFILIGFFIEKTKRNWFIGIRTPWTLSSDYVWDKTHKLGGHLFRDSGFISLIGIFLPNYALWFILVPISLSVVCVFLYSYLIYRKVENKN